MQSSTSLTVSCSSFILFLSLMHLSINRSYLANVDKLYCASSFNSPPLLSPSFVLVNTCYLLVFSACRCLGLITHSRGSIHAKSEQLLRMSGTFWYKTYRLLRHISRSMAVESFDLVSCNSRIAYQSSAYV